MLKSFQQDADIELIDPKEYTLYKDEKEIYFRIGKTKTSKFLVIQAQYENNKSNDFFQTKLTLNNLKEKSEKFKKMKKLEESYVIFIDLFEAQKVHVKDIINKNHLKLVFEFEEKNLEINLPYKNFENKILLRKAQTQNEFSVHRKNVDINININENLNLEDIYKIDEFTENKNEQQNNNEINQKQEDENKSNANDNTINEHQNEDKNIEVNENEDNTEGNNSEKIEINKSENENSVEENKILKEEKNSENIIIEDNTIEQTNTEENKNNIIEDNKKDNIKDINNEKNNNDNVIDNNNDDNKNVKRDEIGDSNENKITNENEEVKIEGDKNNENNIPNENKDSNTDNDKSVNINELLEKIKKLENENISLKEKNKKLEEEKIQLIEKISSEIKFKDEKLKKSEKEKESLKMEIQKLKNVLKKNNIILRHSPIRKKKPSEEYKLNTNRTIEEPTSKPTSSLAERMKIFEPKESQNQPKIESQIKAEKESKNKIENNNKINLETKKEVNQNKINENKINVESKPPINLKVYKTLTQSSYITTSVDNTFDVFTSLNNEILLVYATKFKSIEFFDIVKQKYHKTILNAHNGQILTIRHYRPRNINKDMILSGSNGDYSVKVWDLETFTCICNINKIYQKGNMYSVCILFDVYQKESYVYTSCDKDYIKIFDFNGKFKKDIIKTNLNETYFIDTYYDRRDFKYYLISGDIKSVKSYDVNTDQLFRNYSDSTSVCEHVSAFVYKSGDMVKLVECEFYGAIRIWSFHTGNLIKKIDVCRRIPLVSMCLWNENYLLVSCVDNTIKLIDFKNYALIKSLEGHNDEVCTIKKIIHPNFGECLLSQGFGNEQIKMWINN